MTFSAKSFQKINFSKAQIKQYFSNAKKDLETARDSDNPDVILHFCYSAVLKLGISLIAEKGYKVRSIPGHHIVILDKLAELTGLEDEIN